MLRLQVPLAHSDTKYSDFVLSGLAFQMNSFRPGKKNSLVRTMVFPCLSLPRSVLDTPAETIRSAKRKEVADSVLLFRLLNGLGFLCVNFFNRNTHRKGKVVDPMTHGKECQQIHVTVFTKLRVKQKGRIT